MVRLIWQELKFRRNAIIGWGLGLCFFPLVYISIYPSIAEEMAGLADLELYKALGMNLGTFGDWVGSILIVFMPLIAAIYGVINGTETLAGEEEDGRLEMLVTLPRPRWQIIKAKAIALTVSFILIFLVVAVVSWLVFLAIESQIETDLEGINLFMAVLSGLPLAFAVGMISMFLAAFCSTRRVAAMIAAAILISSYFGTNLANASPVLEPFAPLFLFNYLDASSQAVAEGQQVGDMVVLITIGLVAFILALVFFQRRDLTVGIWPWQRAKPA
ncbi:MAG: ABC transporter permease subunit [Anaerolineae bacterium]|nr:ABC transporter permease subunit [Anaerolineae bacterium]